MIKDITLGQYYSSDSIIHKLDARIKILAVMLYIVELFVVNDFLGFAVIAALLVLAVVLSKVPLEFMFRGLKPVFIILMITFALNIFMIDGEVVFSWKFISITREGIYTAVFMAIRLVMLIVGTSILTLTTRPIDLTDGLERLLKPLKKIGIPTHEIAMMMSIALRFVPTLLEETDKIMKAQKARGADFESGSLVSRAKNLIPILVPLFVGAFRIAQDLAMAMEARCYRGGENRTRMHVMQLAKRDYIALGIVVVFLALVILERIYF